MDNERLLTAREVRWHVNLPIILFFMLTIGNYSFLRYSYSGSVTLSGLTALPYLRVLLPLWIIGFAVRHHFYLTWRILKINADVVLLTFCWLVSSLLSLNVKSYLLYGCWSLVSFWSVLLFLSFNALLSDTVHSYFSRIMASIWTGNLLILGLLLLSLILRPPSGGIYTLLFTSNTFWAYPVFVIGTIALIRIRPALTPRYQFMHILILGLCIFSVYLSARRSPFLILASGLILSYLSRKLSRVLILILFTALYLVVMRPSFSQSTLQVLPESFMSYRLKRMFGYMRNHQETSYQTRLQVWDHYLKAFQEHPVWGNGLAFNPYRGRNESEKREQLSSHNTFVGILAETGVVGMVVFIFVILKSLYLLKRRLPAAQYLTYFLLFIPTLTINWVEYNLTPGQILFMFNLIVWLFPRGLLCIRGNPL